MFKLKWLALLVLILGAACPCLADEGAKLVGTWRLVSFEVEIQATGQKEPVMGQHPMGYVIFTPDGRAMFLVTGDGRKPAETVQESADLLNTMIAYTGTHRVEGDKWITKVDVAWNPEWVGTEQARFFKVEGDRLQVSTPWRPYAELARKGYAAEHHYVRTGEI